MEIKASMGKERKTTQAERQEWIWSWDDKLEEKPEVKNEELTQQLFSSKGVEQKKNYNKD